MLSISESVDDPFAFTFLVDDVLQSVYRDPSTHPDMVAAKAIIQRLYKRQLYKIVGETVPTNNIAVNFCQHLLFQRQYS